MEVEVTTELDLHGKFLLRVPHSFDLSLLHHLSYLEQCGESDAPRGDTRLQRTAHGEAEKEARVFRQLVAYLDPVHRIQEVSVRRRREAALLQERETAHEALDLLDVSRAKGGEYAGVLHRLAMLTVL